MAVARVRVPKQVGRYQLIYEIGASYLGPLWATRVEGGDTLALLRLVSLARLDSDARVRLLEAAWQAMEVRDDRVSPVTDVVASDGELSVVSEYAEGLPLRAAQTLASVRRKPMSVPIALRLILDLSDGVVALHRAMTELGDEAVPLFGGISADSVLVTADGRATLLDVAISSAASTVDALGRSPERVAYAAPEQLGEQARADARTDVFSVGTLAWELLANRRLFVGSDKAVAQKVLAAKVPKLEDAARKGEFQVPPRLGAAVLRALSLEPGARFESMEAFRSALDSAGVTPAEPAVVASYVAAIADGAFARTREALSLPPRPAPARPLEPEKPNIAPKPSSTMLAAARPTEPKASPMRATSHAKLAMPARPTIANRTAANGPARPTIEAKAQARPGIEPKPQAQPSVEAKPQAPSIEPRLVARPSIEPQPEAPPSVTTSKRVSIDPKPGDGWRALDAPPSARSTPPAKIRPRQQTMIGLPAPAGASPEARPPAPITEPPPSSSEEPTAQYSREHLKQLAERQTTPSTNPPPPDVVAPQAVVARAVAFPSAGTTPAPDSVQPDSVEPKLVSEPAPPLFDTKPPAAHAEQAATAREVPLPRLVSLRPTPRPLSEIHTERPPPPEPESTPPTPHAAPGFASAAMATASEATSHQPRTTAGLPPAPEEIPPVRVAPPPPPARIEASGGVVERPAFSRPPPATVAASIYPSQVAPPLIHDPRANRAPSMAPPPARRSVRGIVLGVVASLSLVAISATIALVIMSHRGDASAREVHAPASTRSDVLTRTESPAAQAPPANETTTTQPPPAPAASETPHPEPTQPEPAAAEVAEKPEAPASTSASPIVEGSGNAAISGTPPRAPAHAATPRAPRAARKPAKKRFVPSDI